jgi:hypothetical protein
MHVRRLLTAHTAALPNTWKHKVPLLAEVRVSDCCDNHQNEVGEPGKPEHR